MSDVFLEVKERVALPEAARLYGYIPNRAGFITCPFHAERTPSLKLWQDHWYCFGCHEGGSVVDFTARLFGLSLLDAVAKLNADFSLGLPLDRPQTRQERAEADQRRHETEVRRHFEIWRAETLDMLCSAMYVGNQALRRTMDTWSPAEVEAVRWLDELDWWQEELEAGDRAAQMEIFRDRRGVERKCRMILGSTPQRSKLA